MSEISIVIRTFNEEKYLPALFDGCARQGYRDFEVVVVDSGSYDHTREIAASRGAKVVRISSHDFTFGHSLNVGIEAAQGRFIVMVSAHTEPVDEHWLGRLVEPLRGEKTAMVYGRQCGDSRSRFSEVLDFERTYGWLTSRVLRPPEFFANNANSAVRRDLWQRRSFDESLPGLEDIEWAKHWMEQGYDVVYAHEANIHHIHDESWAQIRRRYYREGQAAKWIGVKGRRDLPMEAGREAFRVFSDMYYAARHGRLLAEAFSIARFRGEKLLGTTRGIWDGAVMENPLQRERLLFDRRCLAVVVSAPGQASMEEVDLPALKPSEVLLRVAFEGVCGTDLEILRGSLGYYKDGMGSYPVIPGHEVSGVVAAVGAKVESVREGDRVIVECIQGCGSCVHCQAGEPINCSGRTELGVLRCNGGYAEYLVTQSRFLHVLPENLTLRDGCLCEPIAVVLKGLRRLDLRVSGRPGPGRCMVIGAGPIGHVAAKLLLQRGNRVAVVDANPRRLKALEGLGLDLYTGLERLKDFDTVIEATGSREVLEKVLPGTASGCAILILGFPYGPFEFNFERIVGFDKAVVGSVGSGPADFREAVRLIPTLDVRSLQDTVLPLADYRKAWEIFSSGERLKVLLQSDPAAS